MHMRSIVFNVRTVLKVPPTANLFLFLYSIQLRFLVSKEGLKEIVGFRGTQSFINDWESSGVFISKYFCLNITNNRSFYALSRSF